MRKANTNDYWVHRQEDDEAHYYWEKVPLSRAEYIDTVGTDLRETMIGRSAAPRAIARGIWVAKTLCLLARLANIRHHLTALRYSLCR